MSFSKTTEQVRNRTKTVTRRWGWWFLKPGDRVQAVEKGMGLKKGEKIKRIHIIECVDVRPDLLCEITKAECVLEGFPEMDPEDLVDLLLSMRPRYCFRADPNRIEFKYVD